MDKKDHVADAGVKRRKTSCTHCRQRKSKCDGRHPQCSTCIAYKTHCRYDKPPSLAYVRSLEAKVESLMAELKGLKAAASYRDLEGYHPLDSAHDVLQTIPPGMLSPLSGSNDVVVDQLGSQNNMNPECATWVSEISLDGNGGVSYHNPTSAMYEAPPSESPDLRHDSISSTLSSRETTATDRTRETNEMRQALVQNAANQRHLEESIVDGMAMQGDTPREVLHELLNLHWCWIHPLFLFVYRPAFIHDMGAAAAGAHDTPYYSDALLKVMSAHTSRFLVSSPVSLTRHVPNLVEQARNSLGTRMSDPSSIPMVQALLQQSAREVSAGRSSQAWLYSGMAFRMAVDMGIHLPGDKLQSFVKTLTAEDVEVRKRLFWSCYTWDKTISLYLGRMPYFLGPIPKGDITFMDDFSETELWEPYYGSTVREGSNRTPSYPPTESLVISTFIGLCKLSVILSRVMLDIYGSTETKKGLAFLRICNELRQWWLSLPSNLQLVVDRLPSLSPPAHIVSLNLLYHTTLILLHRPFVIGASNIDSSAVQRSYHTCLTSTSAIHDLLSLQVATFGYGHVTYLNAYSAYIAATVAILHYQLEEDYPHSSPGSMPGEKFGLRFFLGVLQKTAKAMPGLNRSVDIIKRRLQNILEHQAKRRLAALFPENRNRETGGWVEQANYQSTEYYQPPYSPQDTTPGPQKLATPAISEESYVYQNGPVSVFSDEGLPAFPGQRLAMDQNFQFDSEIVDSKARAALLGQHLDPHVRLHHENNEWGSGYYLHDEIE